VIAAIRNAIAWGSNHPAEVAVILEKSANLPEADAKVYAAHWSELNSVTLEPIDIATLKHEHDIFVADGSIKGTLPADAFASGPYEASKKIGLGAAK
jgi:NitT/TauT family transport system substrate-binding protein